MQQKKYKSTMLGMGLEKREYPGGCTEYVSLDILHNQMRQAAKRRRSQTGV